MKKFIRKYREIISYLFWGVLTTAVSWLSYTLFVSLLNTGINLVLFSASLDIALANALSWICAVAFAFITNKIFVFESRSWKRRVVLGELWKFVSARIVTGIIEIIAVPALAGLGLDAEIFGIAGSWAKIIVSVAVVLLNYIFSRLFVFRKKNTENGEGPRDKDL